MPVTKRLIFFAASAAGYAGCMVGPTYHAPRPALPSSFAVAGQNPPELKPGALFSAEANPELLQLWWTLFHDPALDTLIDRALRNNRDLKLAVSRVREARAERAVAAGALLPEVDATAGYNRGYGSKNVQLPLGALSGGSPGTAAASAGSGGGSAKSTPRTAAVESGATGAGGSGSGITVPSSSAPPGGPNTPFGEGGLPGVTTNLYQAGFDAVWEIDIFGGTRRTLQAADAQTDAAEEGERGVRVTLLAEVASNYLQLRAEQTREAVVRQNLEAQQLTWKIVNDKFNAGLGDEVQAAQQAAQLQVTAAALPPLIAAERAAQHALAFLLGEDPNALAGELSAPRPLPELPVEIPIGIPSELLRRRPDIRQAERNLAAATAEVGVATAQLFPQFSLTGALGVDSSELKQLPEWGSHYYSISPGIRWPILDWAQLHAAIRVESELQQQAVLAYQTAVAQALKEVEDALVQYESEHTRQAELAAAVTEARRARQVAGQIYGQGLADEIATLAAEQALLQVEDSLAQSDASLRIDLVALYKALGGGWDLPPRPRAAESRG
jgi:outer membrane protein, multidrug efflux system